MILDGKRLSEKRIEILEERIGESGLRPHLATVLVGENPASQLYVTMKQRACERVGIGSVSVKLPENASTKKVLAAITRFNEDPQIDGILVQLPLPEQIPSRQVLETIAPEKDVDGFHPLNLGRLFMGNPVFVPCTPRGIMTLLEEYHLPTEGKDAVVVGRSIDVGRPLGILLLSADATVTLCHSRTTCLEEHTRRADILVTAVGKARFITAGMVKEGATVIDVGTSYLDGKLCGDVDFNEVAPLAGAITPVPGGVGPMTIASLMENTFYAASMRHAHL
ncbi:MAG: bifunctional methylenetetrahydrofolate dehydrogenase/methenyltetrahydrofolate cyclohydrolase FolD [Methanomicrobiales archaeon]|nr:bifunctional methylenetetrahydrofolate dehydrogenase/methenyltetrahydrofolate cyclohydrolase FolD [Methanomicrobiales archaeon]